MLESFTSVMKKKVEPVGESNAEAGLEIVERFLRDNRLLDKRV